MRRSIAADSVLELLFPSNANCVGCGSNVGAGDDWLCKECKSLMTRIDVVHSHDDRNWPKDGLNLAFGLYRYTRPITGVIHCLKYDGVFALADFITEEMAESLLEWEDIKVDRLVPVPMHASRERTRGYNQTNILAQKLSDKTGIPFLNALKRVVNTKQQALCSDEERRINTLGAFRVTQDVKGLNIMLVDDVLTSGATANACAATLRSGGAKEVNLITIASARN